MTLVDEAVAHYRQQEAEGNQITGAALAARFQRSSSWGRAAIRAARAAPAGANQPPATVEPEMSPVGLSRVASEARPQGRGVAWLAFVFAALASMLGNLLATWLPVITGATTAGPAWQQQAAATVWTVALLLAVEVLMRTRWNRRSAAWVAASAGLAVVAAGAAVISYNHMAAVLATFGYGALGAHVGPLVVDGLALLSGVALLTGRNHRMSNDDSEPQEAMK